MNEDGQCNVSEWTDIIAISANEHCTVGLKSDGTCVATGANDRGQCNVSPWKNIVNISTSGLHTVGLKADGTLVATGSNKSNECDVANINNAIFISAGYDCTAIVSAQNECIVIGTDKYQNLRNDWNNVKSISFYGQSNCVAIKSDGEGACVFSKFYSSLDNDDFKQGFKNFNRLIEVASGYNICLGLRSDGTVVQAGELDYVSYDGNTTCVRNPSSKWENILVRK